MVRFCRLESLALDNEPPQLAASFIRAGLGSHPIQLFGIGQDFIVEFELFGQPLDFLHADLTVHDQTEACIFDSRPLVSSRSPSITATLSCCTGADGGGGGIGLPPVPSAGRPTCRLALAPFDTTQSATGPD